MDPYHHAYHNEIGPFVQTLAAFQARIHSFDYPDNATLQKLVLLSTKIQQLPLSSPLMRWLIGLETLLGKVQEWEQSAASFVSLKGEMAQLSKFVIRWRKIELESWSMVLDRRTKEARRKTSALWFHLHESLLQAQANKSWKRKPSGGASWIKLSAANSDAALQQQQPKSTATVFKLLDEFCRLSTLGDFSLRCELLHSFANYCQSSSSSSTSGGKEEEEDDAVDAGNNALSCTLRNLAMYYEQFAGNCQQALAQNRAPIQTKLANQVKISSWDDRNYFALKESADKSHRIILRLAKEFDEVLESPVHVVFAQTARDYVADEPRALASFPLLLGGGGGGGKSKSAQPQVRLDLAAPANDASSFTPIYRRARELVERRIATSEALCENHEIPRELFELIKDRLLSLDKDSPVQWKKRALVDLFHEFKLQLKGAPPVPHRLRDFQEIFSSPLLLQGTSPTSLFAGLFHLNHLRNLVRSPAADRSEDLSQEECNRGVSIGESIMLMMLQQRECLVDLAHQQRALAGELAVWSRIRSVTAGAKDDQLCVFDRSTSNLELETALAMVSKGCRDLDFLANKLVAGYAGLRALHLLPDLQQEIAQLKLGRCCSAAQVQGLNTRLAGAVRGTLDEVSKLAKLVPSCDKLVSKIASLQGREFAASTITAAAPSSASSSDSDACATFVQKCQLFIQPLALATAAKAARAAEKKDKDDQDDEQDGLRAHHDWLLQSYAQMRPAALVREMRQLTQLVLAGKVDFAAAERDFNVASLAELARAVLDILAQSLLVFHNAVCRLEEFVLKLFRSVVERGFCRPPEEQDEDDERVDENLKDGMGMGEGQGRDDVSKEIEDEEQLLGLKGDKPDDERQKDKKKKDGEEEDEEKEGVEMENDFDGGEMHDVDRDEDKDDDKDEDEEDEDEEEKEELDRDMGDTGDKSQTVDEKLWDEKEDEKTEDEKFEDNAPMKGEEQELRAKDGKDEDKSDDNKKKDEDDNAQQKQPDKKKKKDEEKEDDEAGKDDEGNDGGEFKPEEVEESSGLDKEQEDGDDDDDGEDEDEDNKMPEMEGDVGEEGVDEDEDDENRKKEPEDFEMPDTGPPPADDANDDDDEEGGEDLNELADEDDDGDNEKNKPDEPEVEPEESDGRLTLPTQAATDDNERKEENQDVDNDAFVGQGTTSNRNNQNDDDDKQQQEQLPQKEEEDQPGASNQRGGTSGGASGDRFRKGADEQQQPEEEEEEDLGSSEQAKRKDLNPWRDPGDASKEWSRRKRIVDTAGGAEDNDQDGGDEDMNKEHQTVEFKKRGEDDDEDQFDQALGPRDDNAEDEARVEMEEEEEEDKPQPPAPKPKKKDEEEEEEGGAEQEQEDDKPQKKKKQQQQRRPKRGKFFDDLEESSEDDDNDDEEEEEEEEQREDAPKQPPQPPLPAHVEPFLLVSKPTEEEEEDSPLRPTPQEHDEVEIAYLAGQELDHTLLSESAVRRGQAAWQRAVNDTFESAQHLCEQLRLVLEPTTATKLKGDYRTGTRINMRRVIAYIASGYKKDKIWQKRSKPSRRKYHIALAIDDSKSMKPCQDLAMAALALITRALTQLEVGEVGIWSFGDEVRKLHDLSKPFSESTGALVSAQFGFDQNSTCIEQGLSTVIDTLTKSAQGDSSSGSRLSEQPKQLVFVISDGRFDTGSRPRIARLLRQAKERKQLVALIVVEPGDEAAGGESILDVRQVSFGANGVAVSRYLEDYPFPYYIVLRDMKALPEVLADGLKQWFELMVGDML